MTDEQVRRISVLLRPGVWLQLVAGTEKYTVVVLEQKVDSIRLKLFAKGITDMENWDGLSFTLSFEKESSPLSYLTEFWSDRKSLVKMPGWANFLMAHHGMALPVMGKTKSIKFYSGNLNHSQQNAVTKALAPRQNILSIQGPPGTGKTAVVAEIIQQVARSGKKILVLAPSRKAINNVSARVHQLIQNPSYHCNVTHGSGTLSINDRIRSHDDFSTLEAFLPVSSDLDSQIEDSTSMKRFNQAMRLKATLKTQILEHAKVVYSTIQSSVVRQLQYHKFQPDYVVIDEAAQTWECVAWQAALLAPKVIFVGDQNQLTASAMSAKAAENGLTRTVMEHIEKNFGKTLQTRLTKQYRANEKIMRWSNEVFYDGEIEADESVKNITIDELLQNPKGGLIKDPIVFYDTAEAGHFYREKRTQGISFENPGEANVLIAHVKRLIEAGIRQEDIGIITPYTGQVRLLREANLGLENVLISTVDGFQGGEHEVILLSLVRSNNNQSIGFLTDLRRMNVSLTRAKRQLFIVGDSRMLQVEPALKRLHEILLEEGKVVTLKETKKTAGKAKH
uniref:DNA helicase n=2 Tax=Bursaphelenchus xylophilus TaxID=6326 RepID=A0A1I7S5E0_BURXY